MLNVVMLSVAFSYCYAECNYDECHYAECHQSGGHYAECGGAILYTVIGPTLALPYFKLTHLIYNNKK
jgi:hypothetical protein